MTMGRMLPLLLSFLPLACLFDPDDARGLSCRSDRDCGPRFECVDRVCGGRGDGGGAHDGPGPGPGPGSGEAENSEEENGEAENGEAENGDPETGAECAPHGELCNETACCDGAPCIAFEGTPLCTAYCSLGSDCDTCCCGATDQNELVCAPSYFCDPGPNACNGACGLGFSPCNTDSDCCDGVCRQTFSGVSLCFTPCSGPADCATGCCAFEPSGLPVCQPIEACA